MNIQVDEQLFIEMLTDYITNEDSFDYLKYHKERIEAVNAGTVEEFDAEQHKLHIKFVTDYITKIVKMNIITEEFGKKLIAPM